MPRKAASAAERRAGELAGRTSSIGRLTARELEVARLTAVGLDNKEIADLLVMAGRTVEAHLRHIFEKLNVDRRAAVAFLLAPTLVPAKGAGAQRSRPAGLAKTSVARSSRSGHHGRRRR